MYSEDLKEKIFSETSDSEIRNRMLARIKNNMSKLEGSFLFDAIAPVSVELSAMYRSLEGILDMMFLKKATGEYLEKRAAEYDINRKTGSFSTGEVEFFMASADEESERKSIRIKKGTLVKTSLNLEFITTQNCTVDGETGVGKVAVMAKEKGSIYNIGPEEVKLIGEKVGGIEGVINHEGFIGGTDIESDEELAKRLIDRIQNPATSGNKKHYEQWALSVDGVGEVKVIPQKYLEDEEEREKGVVRVVLINNEKGPVNEETLDNVRDKIEGCRPVGAKVIIESAKVKSINVNASVELEDEKNIEESVNEFKKKLDMYARSITFKAKEISYAKIGAILIECSSVKDYFDLNVNEHKKNIAIDEESIPVFKVNLTVKS